MEDAEDYELEEEQKTYPKYEDMNYDDLSTNFDEIAYRRDDAVQYSADPLLITDLNSELNYVKKQPSLTETAQTTFTEGEEGTVNISGPSGSTTVPGVEYVEDPNNLLPDVLDAFNDSFTTDWGDIEDRLSNLKKFSTSLRKRDFENQVERVQAVTRVIQTKEKVVLSPRNRNVRELIKRSSVKTLKDGTEVLMFRSEQGINKSGTQILKRGEAGTLVYSKDSPALREYAEFVRKIRREPELDKTKSSSEESVYGDTREEPKFDISDEEYADRENIELIDLGATLGDISGLTMQENNEPRGVLNPPDGSDLRSRIGPEGALQIQADYFNEAIGETVERTTNAEGVTEYNALIERIDGLKEARDKTLKQRALEEAREEQLEDISRLRRFSKWLGDEKVGLTEIAISTAGLITTLLIHARGAIVKTANTTSKLAKALAKLAKKAGPILVPILNALASALKYGAKGVAWLASNLWVIIVAIALITYDYNTN